MFLTAYEFAAASAVNFFGIVPGGRRLLSTQTPVGDMAQIRSPKSEFRA
jgi:hypothetical protein